MNEGKVILQTKKNQTFFKTRYQKKTRFMDEGTSIPSKIKGKKVIIEWGI